MPSSTFGNFTDSFGEFQILLLADRKVGFDWLYLRDGGENRSGPYKIPDLSFGQACDSSDQRAHLGKSQIQLSLIHLGFRGSDDGFGSLIGLDVVIQLRLWNGTFFGQRCVASDVELGLPELGFRLSQLPLCLLQCGFKWTRIYLEQYVALVDDGAFRVVLLHQVAGYLRLNLCVHVAVERCDAFRVQRDILLDDVGDLHLRGRDIRSHLLFPTPDR